MTTVPFFFPVIWSGSVSYTHLDVYKRQCISVNGELTESIGSGQAAEVQARGIEVLGLSLIHI